MIKKKEDLQKGVIFDMDGVIIDSNPYHRIAWNNFLKRNNVEINDSTFKELIFGTTGVDAIDKLFNNKYSRHELENFTIEIDSEYRDIIRTSNNIEPVNGVIKFMKSISDKNYKMAIATSAPTENVDLILNKFMIFNYFDLVIDKTQISKGKPNPEIYLKAVQGLGLRKANCIVFEDSISGIISAKNADLIVIGVTTSHTNNELINVGATLCINDFSEISVEDIDSILEKTLNKIY